MVGCDQHRGAPGAAVTAEPTLQSGRVAKAPALSPTPNAVIGGAIAYQEPAGAAQPEAQPQAKKGGKAEPPVERKIKYTAELKIICEDLPKGEEALKAAIKASQGVIASSEITGSPGSPRTGFWRVRVPVARFDEFREAVRKLGEVQKNTSDSEDMTEMYYDLEQHIKNKRAEEESLRKLLEKSGDDKIESLLAIRRELAGVRDDINRKEGKLRLIANLTDLTTVTVTLQEKQKYTPTLPPDIAEAPTFGMRISHTFGKSWDAVVAFVQVIVLAAAGVIPWLPLLALIGIPLVMAVRRSRHEMSVTEPQVATPNPPPST
jgi:hypothetical protein